MRKLLFNPGPTNVNIEVKQALITENHSHRDEEFLEVFERVCSNLVKICYGEQTHCAIPFVASGTGANEAILSSITGKLLIIENGRYSKRLIDIASKYKHNIKIAHFDPLIPIDLNQVKEILSQDQEIQYVVAVHHETTTSLMIPLQKLGELSKQFNTPLIIDGISSIGAHDFNVKRDNIAFCSVSANKCLESLPGVSFVVACNSELNKIKGQAQTYYFDLYRQWQYTLKKRLPFTAAIQLFFALDVALERLLSETVEGRSKRYISLKTYLKERLKTIGIEAFNIPDEFCSNILSLFHLPQSIDLNLLSEKMKERKIIIYTDLDTHQRSQFFLATMGDLIKGEIDYFIENFQQALKELGFQPSNIAFLKKAV
jgi:2-aminoethylphosphonate-pyruvate transaminase